MYVTYSLSLPPVAVFGFTGGDTSYMSCAPVSGWAWFPVREPDML